MTLQLSTEIPVVEEIEYPSEDGVPMAESDAQRKALMYCVAALGLHFIHDPNVYVSGNLLIYYEKGNIHKSFAPDTFVVFGVPKHDRLTYKIWEEGKAPDVVIEIASKSTWKKDIENRKLYSQLGVKEYFQFDPTGGYLKPRLQGFWLDDDGTYQQMTSERWGRYGLKLESMVLKLELCYEKGRLRLYDPYRQEFLLSDAEIKTQQLHERAQRLQEQAKRLEIEAQVKVEEAKRVEAEAIAKTQEVKRVEAEARAQELEARAQELEARADHEAQLRAELEARLRELEAQLAQQHPNT